VAETAFKEVTKEQFKEVYFRLGNGAYSGWTADYWLGFYENQVNPDWKFLVEEPRSSHHDQMWIVADHATKEHRLFFLTDESTESFFDYSAKE